MITGKFLPRKTPLPSCRKHPFFFISENSPKREITNKNSKEKLFWKVLIAKSEGENSKNCHISTFGL
jgi:hypothetical protein